MKTVGSITIISYNPDQLSQVVSNLIHTEPMFSGLPAISSDLRLVTVDQMSNDAYLAARNPRPEPGRGQIEAGQEPRSGEIGLRGDLNPGPKLRNSFSKILRLTPTSIIPGVPFSLPSFLKNRSPKFPGGNF